MKFISSVLLCGVTTISLSSIIACKKSDTSPQQDSMDAEVSSKTNQSLPSVAIRGNSALKQVSPKSAEDSDSLSSDSIYIPLPTIDKPTIDKSSKAKPVTVNRSAELVASKVARNLELSQAKLAAKSHDICPKLLFSEVDSPVIQRFNEVLKSGHCDYFIYPHRGSRIHVRSEPNVVKAALVSPVVYDFSNGSYVVNETDKHIIRLYYNGSEFRTQPFTYNLTLRID